MATDIEMADVTAPPETAELGLPFPKLVDGDLAMEKINIEGLRKTRLQELCQMYRLPHSGNIALLKKRLQEFSGKPDSWGRLKGPARNSHLGPRKGKSTNTSTQKQSARRREAIFKNTVPQGTGGLPATLSTETADAKLIESQQHKLDMDWAMDVITRYPYRDEETLGRMAQEQASYRSTALATEQSIKESIDTANSNLHKILNCVSVLPTISDVREPSQKSGSPGPLRNSNKHNFHWQMPYPSPPHPYLAPTFPDALQASFPAPPPTTGPRNELEFRPASEPTRTITLANSRKITFTAAEAGYPPAISFANLVVDLPILNGMWDDSVEHWAGWSHLNIKGVPIPIVYWNAVFTSKGSPRGAPWMPKQWKGTKGKWCDWKFLVQRWRQGTPEQFWDEFTVNGKHLGYKAINKRLADARVARNRELSVRAKEEYGNEFAELFSYEKDGKHFVKEKDSHIAAQYLSLKGLAHDDDDDDVDN